MWPGSERAGSGGITRRQPQGPGTICTRLPSPIPSQHAAGKIREGPDGDFG